MIKRKKRKIIIPRKFHYTVGEKLKSIIESGEIRLATARVNTVQERPAVFFSMDKQWEPTALKTIIIDGKPLELDTLDKMIKYAGPIVRIEIIPDAAPYKWSDYVRLSGIEKQMARDLQKSAEKLGSNVNHFFVSFQPVKSDKWLSVEIMDESKIWRTIESGPESLKGKL